MIDTEKQHAFARMILGGVTLDAAKTDGVVVTPEEESGWIEVAKEPTKYGYVNETAGAWIPSFFAEWKAKYLPNEL
jgi:hypothetical protein